jgi:hypothetical protein
MKPPFFTALAWLAACGPAPAPRTVADTPASDRSNMPADRRSNDSLRVVIDAPEDPAPGAPVRIVLRVQNVTDRTLDLYLTGRPTAFDMTVTDASGTVVWRRLEGETIAMAVRIESLPPHGQLEFTHTWDRRSNAGAPVSPGTYTIRGHVPTEDGPLEAPARRLHIRPA